MSIELEGWMVVLTVRERKKIQKSEKYWDWSQSAWWPGRI